MTKWRLGWRRERERESLSKRGGEGSWCLVEKPSRPGLLAQPGHPHNAKTVILYCHAAEKLVQAAIRLVCEPVAGRISQRLDKSGQATSTPGFLFHGQRFERYTTYSIPCLVFNHIVRFGDHPPFVEATRRCLADLSWRRRGYSPRCSMALLFPFFFLFFLSSSPSFRSCHYHSTALTNLRPNQAESS